MVPLAASLTVSVGTITTGTPATVMVIGAKCKVPRVMSPEMSWLSAALRLSDASAVTVPVNLLAVWTQQVIEAENDICGVRVILPATLTARPRLSLYRLAFKLKLMLPGDADAGALEAGSSFTPARAAVKPVTCDCVSRELMPNPAADRA